MAVTYLTYGHCLKRNAGTWHSTSQSKSSSKINFGRIAREDVSSLHSLKVFLTAIHPLFIPKDIIYQSGYILLHMHNLLPFLLLLTSKLLSCRDKHGLLEEFREIENVSDEIIDSYTIVSVM
jgi:hypothetical protein